MLLLVDLDGVVYRGSAPVPGVAAVLAARAAGGDAVVYVTNNSMHHRTEYLGRLRALGAPVDDAGDRIVSSGRATARYLVERERGVRRVLVVGAGGLEREIRDVGLEVVTSALAATRMAQEGIDGAAAAGMPDAVVVGLDPQATYLRIAAAADSIRAGARFVATNRDPVFPTERGLRPGAGSLVAAVETASGTTPVAIGKPAPLLLELAASSAGGRPGEAIVVGDSLVTDMAGARAIGARSILMLTGVTTAAQVEALPPDERPTDVARDAADLERALASLAAGSS
ncbi:MAG TPA: HAD-IIA family hydrolase [Candidatus Dormibacteraeota bacterium]|nr:HAD-IIA family hydrolase [Candidatus Dormibacteraeota bacterium]